MLDVEGLIADLDDAAGEDDAILAVRDGRSNSAVAQTACTAKSPASSFCASMIPAEPLPLDDM